MEALTQHQFTNQKAKQIACNLSDGIVDLLYQKILENSITVPKQHIPLPLIQKDKIDQGQQVVKKLQHIEERKKHILEQLQNLKKQEEEEHKLVKANKPQTHSKPRLFKSEFSQSDKDNLKKLSKAKKKFQREVNQKTKQIQHEEIRVKSQKQELRKKEIEVRRFNRKEEAENNLKQIERRHEERQRTIKDQEKALSEIKKGKKLYEEVQVKWKVIEEEEEKRKKQLTEEMKKIKAIDFNTIKQHEKKYVEIMKEQKQSRVQNGSRINSQQKIYYSPFLDNVREEDKIKRQQENQKRKQAKKMTEKKIKYSQIVNENYKPKFKKTEQNHKKQEDNNKSLSFFETHKKGVEYLRITNENAKNHPKQAVNANQPSTFKYQNYLPEVRSRKTESSLSEMEKINEIMKKTNIGAEQKFIQSKILAEKIENKNLKQNQKGLMESINAKLLILKELEN